MKQKWHIYSIRYLQPLHTDTELDSFLKDKKSEEFLIVTDSLWPSEETCSRVSYGHTKLFCI